MMFNNAAALIAISLITLVFGAQLLFFWVRDRQAGWLGWYGAAFVLFTPALLFYLLRADGNPMLSFGVGNVLRFTAFGLLWTGARAFAGRRPEYLVLIFAACVWMALCSVPALVGNMTWRVAGASLFIAMFGALTVWELWRDRHVEALPSRLPAVVTYASFTILVVARLPFLNVLPFPMGALPVQPEWLAGFGLLAFIHVTFFGGFVVSMTRERREVQQQALAVLDPLTGLLNRRAFLDQFGAGRLGLPAPVAMLVLDLDDFKSINDHFGHATGDRVLKHFADLGMASVRPADQLYRMGGEEFCFVLPATAAREAYSLAERIRIGFAQQALSFGGQRVRATVSIGIAATEDAQIDPEALLSAADAAVYEAKARGRNQTAIAGTAGQCERAELFPSEVAA